ncbi:hypothetical protein SPFL3102_01150 [Sporomusaceae bacterium FL31]|nr:hypothetical protein SPFL3101_00241 [Sporomusaceae bacterium FL31]GCE33346.1 hypothetical protein SPFL3102_01150 [Sporomusaceae bacterium]
MDKTQSDFYQKLRQKVRGYISNEDSKKNKYVEYILVAPDIFHLLCKLTLDLQVPIKQKAKLAGAIAYFISPLDLMPEAIIGPLGYIDDLALAAYVLDGIINEVNPDIVKRHWAGDDDILKLIQHLIKLGNEVVGTGIYRTIKKKIAG